ncbi:MAG: hypothetical protein ACK41E_01020 [Deinococcales bacterium]
MSRPRPLLCQEFQDDGADMTLREAMKILELNERTLEISMVESAAKQRMNLARSSEEQDQIVEAYRRVQIFLDPKADERFLLRDFNVLVSASSTQEQKPAVGLEASLFTTLPESLAPPEPIKAPEAIVFDDADTAIFDGTDTSTSVPAEAEVPLLAQKATPDDESALDFDVEINFTALEQSEAEQLPDTSMAAGLDESPITILGEPLIATKEPLGAKATQPDPHETLEVSPDFGNAPLNPVVTGRKSITPEFDDSLLQQKPIPRDVSALTVIETAPQQTPHKERRVSRAAQTSGVKKIYQQEKTTQSQPIWAWILAFVFVIGTGIFAAPALLRQLSATTPNPAPRPQSNLSVPNLPSAPKPRVQPTTQSTPAKPSTVTTSTVKTKPVSQTQTTPKPPTKPAAQPTPKPATPTAVKITPKTTKSATAPSPTASQTTAPKATDTRVQKLAQPTPNKPRVIDAQSAANLPPIAIPKPTPKPAVKPAPKPTAKATTKPVVKPAPKPQPKPVAKPTPAPTPAPKPAIAAEPQPEPVATQVEPTIDPNNLSREQIGRRFLNEKYFEDWLARGANLKYPSWADIPIALQVAPLSEFRSAVLISLP